MTILKRLSIPLLLIVLTAIAWILLNRDIDKKDAISLVTTDQITQPLAVARSSDPARVSKVTTKKLPGFASYKDVNTKKREFFNFMLSLMASEKLTGVKLATGLSKYSEQRLSMRQYGFKPFPVISSLNTYRL